MAMTVSFEETIYDQDGERKMDVEFGRSSFYADRQVSAGTDEDSIYLNVDGKSVVMDLVTAKRFVEAAIAVGRYHSLID
jgi:hypothetical protein